MREVEAGRLHFLIRTVLPLLLLALTVMLYEAYAEFRSTLLDQVRAQLRAGARDGGAHLAELLREYRESLLLMARQPSLRAALDAAPPAVAAEAALPFETWLFETWLFEAYVPLHGGTVAAIALYAADGRLLARAGDALPQPGPAANAVAADGGTPYWHADRPLLLLDAPVIPPAGGAPGRLRLVLDLHTLATRALATLHPWGDGYAWLIDAAGRVVWHPQPAALGRTFAGDAADRDFARIVERMRRGAEGSGRYRFTDWGGDGAPPVEKLAGYAPVPLAGSGLALATTVEYAKIAGPIRRFALQLLLIGSVLALTLIATGGLLLHFRASAERRGRRLDRLQALIGRADQAMFDCDEPDALYLALGHALRTPTPGLVAALAIEASGLPDADARELARHALARNLPVWDERRDGRTHAVLPLLPHGVQAGVLWLCCTDGPPPDAAARTLIAKFAHDVALAIERVDDRARRAEAEADLRLVASVFENIREAAVITDADNRILRVNPAFTTITGYTPAEALGQTPKLLASGRHGREFYAAMWRTLAGTGSWSGEICNRRKDGREYLEWLSISVVRDGDGAVAHHVAVFADLSEHAAMRERLDWLASHDPLTGLKNRSAFVAGLPALLAQLPPDGVCAVLNLDLRRFQRLNEALGRTGGDRVLQALADRLRGCADGPGRLLARIAGDEFAFAIADLPDAEAAEALAEHLHARLAEPLPVLPEPVTVTVDIGYALAPRDGHDGETLLRHAVAAARHARAGGGGWYRFEAVLGERLQRRALLERGLRTALARGELSLAYQPQIALADECVIGVEALMRWHHTGIGAVSPAEFIPIAEETGLIRTLGAWALETACHEAAGWGRHCAGPPRVAVNLSARQFADPDLPATIARALRASGLPPARLEVEITESLLMDDPDRTVAVLAALRRTGVGVAIDDFGTGYSSLAYLKTFPLDRLKIDRSFVRDVTDNADSAAIAQAVIALAHSIGLRVIAEGVEDTGQLDFLRAQGCDEVQGYLYAPPRPPSELHALLVRGAGGGRRDRSPT